MFQSKLILEWVIHGMMLIKLLKPDYEDLQIHHEVSSHR